MASIVRKSLCLGFLLNSYYKGCKTYSYQEESEGVVYLIIEAPILPGKLGS